MLNFRRIFCVFACAFLCASWLLAQAPASLRGLITDPSGAAVPKASVTVMGPGGLVKAATTANDGTYSIIGLPAGTYTLRVSATGFNLSETANLEITAGRALTADAKLTVAAEKQEVTVVDQQVGQVEVDPSKNAGQLVLTGQDLDMLSDDPDDLQNDLMALAGPAAGPNGGQIFVDGFSNGQLPPKDSIREIRINSNPFSAEFDRIGFGRIEILTKPGTDKLRGSLFYQADSSALDARNPYATIKPSFLSQQVQGNLSGSLNKKTSFFFDFNRRDLNDQALIKAIVPDPSVVNFGLPSNVLNCAGSANLCNVNQFVATPQTRTSFSPRVDYQLNSKNTLQMRYTWTAVDQKNTGVGGFNLPTQGINNDTTTQSAQITETSVLNATTVNESRFQYTRTANSQNSLSGAPTILVPGFFSGGPATQGPQFTNTNSFEFQNYTSLTRGAHTIKVGARIRGALESDFNDTNFNGLFSFKSLNAYLATVSGVQQNLPWTQIIANGGGAFQYLMVAGQPLAHVNQTDIGPFIQDDWKIRPSVTISLGMRYEWQTNINDKKDVAPRVGLAWGIGGGQGRLRQPKTVIRAGFGLFYDRFALAQILNAAHLNGIAQQRYVIANPQFFTGSIPPLAQLTATPQASYQIDPNIVAPRIIQTAVGIDRQLPRNTTLSVNFTNSRGLHELLSRNINAPYTPNGPFPDGLNHDPVYQYESGGLFKQNQITVNMNSRFSAKYTMFGFYSYGHADSNTDSVNNFPANSYNLNGDWSRAGFDIRHRIVMGGNLTAPWGIRLAPFLIYNSAAPFNISTGTDNNGDSITTTDRPSFATAADIAASNCSPSAPAATPCVVSTAYGVLNTRPLPGEIIIPRNLGVGFGSLTLNLRVSHTWGFGESAGSTNNRPGQGGQGGPRGGGFGGARGGGGGGPRGGGGGGPFGGATTNRRYNMTLSVEFRNLLNSVNPSAPVGVLSSPQFGEAQGISGFGPGGGAQTANRRMELQLRFNF